MKTAQEFITLDENTSSINFTSAFRPRSPTVTSREDDLKYYIRQRYGEKADFPTVSKRRKFSREFSCFDTMTNSVNYRRINNLLTSNYKSPIKLENFFQCMIIRFLSRNLRIFFSSRLVLVGRRN